MDPSAIQSVLVIKPSSLGDVVHTLPALGVLKARFPEWKIRWLINGEWAPLLEGNPDLEGVVPFPRGECRGIRGWPRSLAWTLGLGELKPDLALDFQGLLRSALMGRFSRARALFGMSDAREGAGWFYDRVAAVDTGAHAVDRYLQLAALAGAPPERGVECAFRLPEGSRPVAASLPQNFVLLHPFSRGRGKAFSARQVEAFCRFLEPVPVVLVGMLGIDDEKAELPGNVIDLVNATNLPELLWLLRRAEFTVSVDSGPMHLAAAVTARLLGVHTWTDPRRVGPYGRECRVWKGGRILRVGDMGAGDRSLDEARESKSSRLADADVETIASFVRSEIPG